MATVPARPETTSPGWPERPELPAVPPNRWFDRSGIKLDAMVTIRGVREIDWWMYAPETRICEYFDGTVYMPSPAKDDHQDQVGFWFDLTNGFCQETGLAVHVRLGPAVLHLAPGQYPEPDVFVVPKGPRPLEPRAFLIVEVLSKSTRSHDLGLKTRRYREAQIPEFVYVDLRKHKLLVRSHADGQETEEVLDKGIWRSSGIPGFWIDVAWPWGPDLPNPRRCLETILAGPPA